MGGDSGSEGLVIDTLRELEDVVLPFFERDPLHVKGDDFANFAAIVRALRAKEHLTASGFERLVYLRRSVL